ncbi:SMUG2 DNA glycosylase family protein [Parabacteroides sp. OttesenSCG-928-G07]|nr:SMUG2 DNA glycosylase family protein [Parabacteroides sp. OttesenSCG-928-G21]MDL2277850.1 SMUG2 DNA glycosylase family protein [Parabacteroides sp. OttesenSCG-928-G07]
MIKTFADNIIEYNKNLAYTGELPAGFKVVNPFCDNQEAVKVMEQFYRKYYTDSRQRKFIIGINPGRHGAGITGIPFTDTKHLENVCGIRMQSAQTHEISSVFVYDMIAQYGGTELFYQDFFIKSPFPLAIVREKEVGKWINANYYDDTSLLRMTEEFMITSLKKQITIGIDCSEVFVLGKKNATYISEMNKKANLFGRITVLEHPRYIQQYKSKDKQFYIDKYILTLNSR